MEWRDLFQFMVASLATWRMSFFLAREDGPGRIMVRLRRSAGDTVLGQLLQCVKCVSLWVSLPMALYVGGSWWELAVVWLALSGVASLIDEATRPPFEWQAADSQAADSQESITQETGNDD